MTRPVPFSGQTPEARARASANSRLSKVANDKAREANADVDWDWCIASLKAYFAKRNHKTRPKVPQRKAKR